MKFILVCATACLLGFFNVNGQGNAVMPGTMAGSGPQGPRLQRPQPMQDTRPAGKQAQTTVADRGRVMDFFQNQQFEEAISYLATALGEDSASVPVLGYLGYAYYMTDAPVPAEACYHRIFDLDSVNVAALHFLELLNHHDDPEMALDYTQRLVDLQPNKPVWWRTKGELLRRLKQSDSALAALGHAYALAPEEVKNITSLAELLIERKNFPLADSMLEAGLGRDSAAFTMLKLRVRSAYLQKDYAAVLVPGERIMRMNLPDINAQSWLALSYYNLKRYPDCIRTCEFLVDAGFDIESVYYYEARALAKMQEYKESNVLLAACLKKAISLTGEWYYNDLGDNYEGLKDPKAAIAHYDTAYYLYKEPTMLYNSGRVAETQLKNTVLARKYYQRYLAVADPQTPEEKKAFAYVRSRWGAKRKK